MHLGKFRNSLAAFVESPFVLFCFALSVSACCKLFRLDSRELWLDETYSAFVANLPFAELHRHLAAESARGKLLVTGVEVR
jgi:hypothetical protein